MKITIYLRLENLSELNNRIANELDTSPVSDELFITENAQRTHFQGWCEVQITYNDYVRLNDLKQSNAEN